MKYGEDLAKTLAQLSPEALARVLNTNESVILSPGDNLNDELDLTNIEFPYSSSTLPDSAAEPLGKIAEYLTLNPTATIRIEGHVSQNFSGADTLSTARANAAKSFLTELGISDSRIESIGKGYTNPLGNGPAANRRIEFFIGDP